MPPWKPEPGHGDFAGSRRLSEDEISAIEQWIAAGTPEGDPADLPAAPRWVSGWQRGEPDLIARMVTPFELPASGLDVFRNFVIPVPVEVSRFVDGIEFRAGSTPAVHHATILVDDTPSSRQRASGDPQGFAGNVPPSADYPDGHFLGWAPGQQAAPRVRGMSWLLKPGSDFVVQLHLKPTGRVERIQPSIAVFFASEPPEHRLSLLRLSHQDIDIPAGAKEYVATDSYVLPVDVDVYAVQPHAHYRAKIVEGQATLPDGTTRWLIRIPDWDFNWQDMYYFRQPLRLPRGTTVSMRYTFDNSEENPRNPQSPPRRVRWGPTSTDEMADLLIELAARSSGDLPLLDREIAKKHRVDEIVGREAQLAANPTQPDLHEDVAQLYLMDGRIDVAIAHFQEAVRLAPESPVRRANLGRALARSGRIGNASAAYEAALALDPRAAVAHNDLGVLLVLQGRLSDALTRYGRALELDSNYAEAHNNLATLLLYLGRAQEAADHAGRAVEIRPDLPEAHYNLARAALAVGQSGDASDQFTEALRLRPDWPTALKDFAWMLATYPDSSRRSPRRAIDLAERAVELTGHAEPVLLDVLAAAYAANQEFDRAAATVRAALRLSGADGADVDAMTERLALYVNHRPYVADFSTALRR
jgi:tetratricopeptide (TPR) repeat protein